MKKAGQYLCMGCNQYFPRKEVELVEGVAFCPGCEGAKQEFIQNRIRAKAEKAAPQALGYASGSDEAKWEASFDTSQMISVSTARARRLKRGIAVRRRAGFFSLLLAAGLDLLPVAGVAYYFREQNPIPAAWVPYALLALLGVFVYRMLFMLVMGKSIGMALAGIRLVDGDGRPAGFVAVAVHAMSFILGRLVDESDWKREAARAVYFEERESKQKVARQITQNTAPEPLSPHQKVVPGLDLSPPPTAGDPWNDPDWKPPQESLGDPWNDPDK